MTRCAECGGCVVWNEDASSNTCTTCGTLTDPSQRVLSNIDDQLDSQYFNTSAPNTLKRLRGGSSWALAGQSKEARVRNNTLTMHEFIKSLTLTLSVSGLSPRACNLFDQAMRTKQFKWGIKAKTVAGACLSIALRESGRPDSLKDMAFLVEQGDVNLKRTLSSVLSALNINLSSNIPAQFLITLQSHLLSILQSPVESCGIKVSLWSELKPLSIHSGVETARLFIDVLSHSTSESSNLQHPPAATACAVFIMSLEAEKRAPLSRLADISAYFADSCTVAKAAVMKRYQALNDEVSRWVKEVEWLDSYQKSSQRAKASKRLLCARGLKDVLNWKHRIEAERRHDSDLPLNTVDSDSETEMDPSQDIPSPINTELRPARKRRKIHSAITTGTHFLLDPLDVHPSSSNTSVPSTACYPRGVFRSPNWTTAESSMTSSYLLSSISFADTRVLPSRLQQLSVVRGGADADVILDDELFAEGEWETIQRTPEEMRNLKQRWRDDGILDAIEKASSLQQLETRSRNEKATPAHTKTSPDTVRRPASKRINLEAFSSFMHNPDDEFGQMVNLDASEILGLEILEDDMDDKGADDEIIVHDEGNEAGAFCTASEPGIGDEITVDDWRPPSPGLDNSLDDYYL
ncbi:hypothetical protein DFH05DRAFT_1408369 [Lentinula detonsa]|uniref:Uncharacterized protein n=1 Tax=Lentinula detonsa TaxID=2804962 RepID=A0A9W8TS27_9AGAR|nr:hypothetical protein DFH05DRAFT_1408369 [Lentinula detonsa]KAJ3987109.1 hypothetical protein F5890DRAFT_854603 [Lentinula detonsa]